MFEHENKGMRKTVLFIYKLVEEYNNSVSYSLVTKPKWVTISCGGAVLGPCFSRESNNH